MTRRVKRPGPRRWPWLVAGVVLIALIIADRSGWLLVPKIDDMTAYHGASAAVLRVIDGDTIEIDHPDALHDRPVTQIRFWGLDCPETAKPDRPAGPVRERGDRADALADGESDGDAVFGVASDPRHLRAGARSCRTTRRIKPKRGAVVRRARRR